MRQCKTRGAASSSARSELPLHSTSFPDRNEDAFLCTSRIGEGGTSAGLALEAGASQQY